MSHFVDSKALTRKYENTPNEYFVWSFTDDEDINLFKNAKRGDIITSDYFETDGCTFYFELTPKGWDRFNGAVVWCAVHKLPTDVFSIEVAFKYICDEVSFEGTRTKELSPSNGVHSFSTNNVMEFAAFRNLNSFSFKCYVKVNKFLDKNGNEIQNVGQEAKMNENAELYSVNPQLLESVVLRLREENTQLNKKLIACVTQTSLLEEQNKEIKSDKHALKTIVDDLLNNQTKLQTEKAELQTEKAELQKKNMRLIDECKELKFELNETKEKYKQLSQQIVCDVKNYKKWNHDNITDWIVNLNEEYVKYEDMLRNKLREEWLTGDYLHELDKSDLDRFGIKSFKHKSAIIKHIKLLTSQQQQQQNEGATAFI